MKSPITTHVLDTTLGKPAAGVSVTLEMQQGNGTWKELACGVTNVDGRITDLLRENAQLVAGEYRLIFNTGEYFRRMSTETFYPKIAVEFTLKEDSHYHVPLLLSPFGYSTYRGS